jgi:hypothetical protein
MFPILLDAPTIAPMTTAADIRRRNARALAQKCGGSAEFARRIDRDDSYVSQLIGETPTRNIGARTARLIEKSFHLDEGWLDVDHDIGISPAILALAEWLASQSDEHRRQIREIAAVITGGPVPE